MDLGPQKAGRPAAGTPWKRKQTSVGSWAGFWAARGSLCGRLIPALADGRPQMLHASVFFGHHGMKAEVRRW